MTKDEALRLALEVLQELEDTNSYWWQEVDEVTTKKIDPAITAIKAALEAKDEPVAWISPTELLVMRGNALGGAKDWRVNVGLKPQDGDVGLYTTPPQRKPLTEQKIGAILEDTNAFGTRLYTFARAIEAAHGIKEKNI
jgi:hypothetical protein